MKKILSGLAAAAALLTGCQKFLDINPKGEVFDADMFTSGEGFEDALYGIYNELATDQYLYAADLWWFAEACSQNVTCLGDYNFGNLSLCDWYNTGPTNIRNKMWADAYKVINHINNIIQHAEEAGDDAFRHSALYHGEALALRAMVHFDLLRIFGPPVWAEPGDKAQAIPYVEKYSFDITPFSSLDEVYDKVIADLKRAETLLSEDEGLVPAVRTNAATGFTGARITHLNLYAVQALLARVYWTRGDLGNAAIYAQKVIGSGKFTFRPLTAFVQPDNGTLDLDETLFGFYSESFQTYNRNKYQLYGSSSQPFSLASDWKTLYEGGSASGSDYRLAAWFNDGSQTLVKLVNRVYYEGTSTTYTGRSIIGANVLRIPEMYYIMAEYHMENGDNLQATRYFDAVTTTRGRDPVMGHGVTLTADMLFEERRREFYGEGFTWHEMKRRGMDIYTAAGTTLPGRQAATYTLPVPDAEWEARNNIEN